MASSQQQWRRGSQLLLLAAALALVLLIAAGTADAGYCSPPKYSCKNKCVNYDNDKYNCGYCGHECKIKEYKYGEAYCSDGHCYEHCKDGWEYNYKGKYCYKSHH